MTDIDESRAVSRLLSINLSEEIDRHFDNASLSEGDPCIVMIMGGVAAGKTSLQRQKYSKGFVLIDAAEIFISLSQGEYFDFPSHLEEPMDVIGRLIASRAIEERRNIVTELIGADRPETEALIEAMKAAGYLINLDFVHCDVEEAMKRNMCRGEDNVSCYYAERFQRAWLIEAARNAVSQQSQT